MKQNSDLGINDVNRKQEIAFDVDVFKDILSNPHDKIDFPYRILYEILNLIRKYHKIAFNLKWIEEIEKIRDLIIDQDTRKYFMQLLLSDLRVDNNSVKKDDRTDDYVYNIAKCLQQKILVTNKDKNTDYKLNTYNDTQFVSDKYKNDCVLYRLPKILRYSSGDILRNFNFLGFYFRDCTLVEFIDSYLLKPHYNSSLELILSFLGQIRESTNVRFHYDITNSKDFEYNIFCNEIKKAYPLLKLCKPKQKNGKNHDRFIIIDENKYSMTFTASFNNIEKKINVFEVNKSFKIIIEEGRLY